MRTSMMAALLSLSALWACGSVTNEFADGGGGSGAGSGGHDASVDGLPCEVVDLLEAQCVSCHSDPPRNAAPMPMVSYEDLAAASGSDPSRTVAEVSVARMRDATASMPPGGQLSTAVIAPFEAWVAAGMPRGDCATGGDSVVCTSGETWIWDDEPPNEDRRPEMNPGMACNSCHMAEHEGPDFRVAGTVYPTYHEPDRCFGAEGVTVEVTDADGQVIVMTTNLTGNFSYEGDALAMPITARVIRGDSSVAMTDPVNTGDCNSCHTQAGANDAPGRIRVP